MYAYFKEVSKNVNKQVSVAERKDAWEIIILYPLLTLLVTQFPL